MSTTAATVGETSQGLQHFAAALAKRSELAAVVQALHASHAATIDGVLGSSCALTIAALLAHAPGALLVVCPQASDAERLRDDLELFWDGRPLLFPAWENDPGERQIYDEIYGERLRTIKALRSGNASGPILCSVQSLLQPVPPPDAIAANTRSLSVGERIGADTLCEWLVQRGFHGTSGVELPGEFSRRGGIVDIFAPDWSAPVRVEWFDDEIESIRSFDTATQRSIETLPSVDITILPVGGDDAMRGAGKGEHLLTYLDASVWCALVEPQSLQDQARRYLDRQDNPQWLHSVESTFRQLARHGNASLWSLAPTTESVVYRLATQSVERFSGNIKRVRDELVQVADQEDVYLVCQTTAETQRLDEVFTDTPIARSGRLHFVRGHLGGGFHLLSDQALVLGGSELFRRSQIRRRARKTASKKIDSFLELREGDLVVHLVHGIGRYRGMQVLKRENQIEDHLTIEFHGKTKVFVPATKIDLVQKYVGATKARPRLATIGGAQWQKKRKAAESAVTDMAAELLEVQAQRAARPGIAFLPDTEWQQNFDASFPYELTADQATAIDAIKDDMMRATPMERLLCGDVGFGKTEVAMRAAFKAIDNGYQVAVLVPTTVLAEQHYHTFQERFAEFPFEIARLSRFCTGAESREIVGRVKDGQIDIVIGTHRLASKDVDFHNLGLLIIDEEQRFGVQVKERLKSLRATVDVLTMTATPIPRTLHMAMTGMRDISNLETPPQDRVAVQTQVTRWDDTLIRSAMLRELNRGGQIYFVHNRVGDIVSIQQKLAEIVPEANIRIGHGQMPEHQLEDVMVDFVAGDFDTLLATTIIESGLDIPNANTIFIDDADHYGLSDLHQLRGRVGRYKHRAYCYLLLRPHKHISPQGAQRLRAIEEFSQMGAGFAIAMRDLEFRGAGNVLGTRQSGHIAAIGYELYCELLEAAVRRLKRMPPKLKADVNVDLPGLACLPDDYVSDQRSKIDLYRRMARIASGDELTALRAELEDRFGRPPQEVLQLLALIDVKVEAAFWQIATVRLEDQDDRTYVVLEYTDRQRIGQLAEETGNVLRVVDGRCAYAPLDTELTDPQRVLARVKSLLRPTGSGT